jgi:dolichol-phosphate mannosyltransferase
MRAIVIVPTYNERDNLDPLIRALLRFPDVDVLVVDDGSPDGTGQLADTIAAGSGGRVSVLHRAGRRGLGRSYVDGMRRAVQADVTAICQMDADFSHNPADIPRLISQAASADLVIGSRYILGGCIENWSRRRIVLSTFANR